MINRYENLVILLMVMAINFFRGNDHTFCDYEYIVFNYDTVFHHDYNYHL
jgi:hypothetical protein